MKRLIFGIAAALFLFAGNAEAGEQPSFEVGYSSYMTTGVKCSSGTLGAALNLTRPTGFSANVAGYRIINQDSADSVWVGGPSVSTSTVAGDSLTNLGELVAAGASIVVQVGKAYGTAASPRILLYCRAADAAGDAGVTVSVAWFGY